MGGRVKRSNGYNLDDFVASSEEDIALSDEGSSEYNSEGASDSDYEAVKAKSKNKPKPTTKATVTPKLIRHAKANTSVKRETKPTVKAEASPSASSDEATTPPPSTRTSGRRTKKHTYVFQDAAEDDELDELIGAETDDDAASSDISSFGGSSESESDRSTTNKRDKATNGSKTHQKNAHSFTAPNKSATTAKTQSAKPTTPEPKKTTKKEPAAAATLPTPNTSPESLKRKRSTRATAAIDSEDSDVEISVFRPKKKAGSGGNTWLKTLDSEVGCDKEPATPNNPKAAATAKSGSFLSNLAKSFGMSARRAAETGPVDLDGGVKIDQDERLEKIPDEEDLAYPSVGDGYSNGEVPYYV